MDAEGHSEEQLPHLETFARAAEMGSFTAAARALGLTQAAVSQRIQALERALGRSLFVRQGGRVTLSEAGRILHDYALRIFELHRQARREVAGLEAPLAGELILAASSVPGEHLLPALLSQFGPRYPAVRVRATISDSLQVLNLVEHGAAHLGLVGRKIDRPHLEYRFLARDHMVLVVPPGHPLAGQERVSVEQLRGQPLLLREAGSGLRHCFEKSLARAGLSLEDFHIALELGSNEAIKEAVLRRVGLAVLSAYAVQKELAGGKLLAREIDLDGDRDMYVVHDRRRALSPPAHAFLAFLASNPIPPPATARP